MQSPKVKARSFLADSNNSGSIDLSSEMTYANVYYAASADLGGKSNYLHIITRALIDGRQLITKVNSEKLSSRARVQLLSYADIIKNNWELVIAKAAFKYAGRIYSSILKLQIAVENNQDAGTLFKDYIHVWGELKGFSMSLQTGAKDLAGLAVSLNRLIGFSPVLLGDTQVIGIDAKGDYLQGNSVGLNEYALTMLKVQKLLADNFALLARDKDQISKLAALAEKLGSGNNTENDLV
ncbi:MAG: hypothetical protein MJK10_22260 [Pseudomonadales bacterium]|nr:hypothetical protein [Pseudomonadales bacterium]